MEPKLGKNSLCWTTGKATRMRNGDFCEHFEKVPLSASRIWEIDPTSFFLSGFTANSQLFSSSVLKHP